MSDFHMPDSWYEPPEAFECDECEDGDGCTCEQDALDEREQDAIDRADAERKERR